MNIVISKQEVITLEEYLKYSLPENTNFQHKGIVYNLQNFDTPTFFINSFQDCIFDTPDITQPNKHSWILGVYFVEQLTETHVSLYQKTLTQLQAIVGFIKNTYNIDTKIIIVSNFQNTIDKLQRNEFNVDLQYYPFFMPYQINDLELKELGDIMERSIKEFDVGFVGCLNTRRIDCINKIKELGLTINIITNTYGTKRDEEIAKCKVLVCLHFYEGGTSYENIRLDRFVFQNMTVVCETSSDAHLIDLKDYVYFADLQDIPALCKEVLNKPILFPHENKVDIILKRHRCLQEFKSLLENLSAE